MINIFALYVLYMIQIFHHGVDKLYPNNWFQLASTMTHFFIIIFYFFIYYLKYRNLNYILKAIELSQVNFLLIFILVF